MSGCCRCQHDQARLDPRSFRLTEHSHLEQRPVHSWHRKSPPSGRLTLSIDSHRLGVEHRRTQSLLEFFLVPAGRHDDAQRNLSRVRPPGRTGSSCRCPLRRRHRNASAPSAMQARTIGEIRALKPPPSRRRRPRETRPEAFEYAPVRLRRGSWCVDAVGNIRHRRRVDQVHAGGGIVNPGPVAGSSHPAASRALPARREFPGTASDRHGRGSTRQRRSAAWWDTQSLPAGMVFLKPRRLAHVAAHRIVGHRKSAPRS